jgi:hypothetical protein
MNERAFPRGAPALANHVTRALVGVLAVVLLLTPLPVKADDSSHDPGCDPLTGQPGIAPQLTLHGFSDVTASAMRTQFGSLPASRSASFALGQLDFYLVSRLAENLSFLSECVAELGDDGQPHFEAERMFVKYAWSDGLRLAAGRTHTAIGFWNEAYHHGTLLQPTVERPEELKFEDDGGILPVHSVGIELSGQLRADEWGLAYTGNVANGRGATRDEVQGTHDENNNKALALRLEVSHDAENHVTFGPLVYHDRIPFDPTTGRVEQLEELITGGFVHAKGQRIELLAEAFDIRHRGLVSRDLYEHRAWYSVVSFKAGGDFKPYAGYERIDFQSGDPFYAPNDADLDRATAGIRWDVSSFNAVKLEYRHDRRPGEHTDGALAQTSFSF